MRDEYTSNKTETAGDDPPPFRVAIVNERFIKKYFPHGNAIGRRIGFGTNPGTKTTIEIVGVVQDAKYTDVRSEIRSQVFFPYLEDGQPGGFAVFVRTSRDANSASPGHGKPCARWTRTCRSARCDRSTRRCRDR